jgi:hypothetical protein
VQHGGCSASDLFVAATYRAQICDFGIGSPKANFNGISLADVHASVRLIDEEVLPRLCIVIARSAATRQSRSNWARKT